jgi:hypothetical protein
MHGMKRKWFWIDTICVPAHDKMLLDSLTNGLWRTVVRARIFVEDQLSLCS